MAYIPNTDADRETMLQAIGIEKIDDLFTQIPENLRFSGDLDIPGRLDQITLARHFTALAKRNVSAEDAPCFLGGGVYDHYVPPTVAAITGRSEFLTAYTPYQPEVSQGTLQSIFEFQTLICELFGMDVANASMYDGATALGEAAIMAGDIAGRSHLIVLGTVNPNYRRVIATYVHHMHLTVDFVGGRDGLADLDALRGALSPDTAAIIAQQPNFFGSMEDMAQISKLAHDNGSLFVASVDPIALGVIAPPGEYDADIVTAEGQSLGCPMGFGGPLLGLFSCKEKYLRRLPGRIVGQTTDADGKRAFVMTLRTREQDIRRERATSNICTNVALYALAGAVYLSTMGRQGLRQAAELSLQKAHYAANEISKINGCELAFPNAKFFKEFVVRMPIDPTKINEALMARGIIGGMPLGGDYPELGNAMLFCVTEQRTKDEIDELVRALRDILI